MGGVRRSDVAIGAVLGAGGVIAQVLLAQERAAAGGSVAAWAVATAIVAVAAVVAPAAAVRWALAGGALVGATAAWALLPAAWWAMANLVRRDSARRGLGWFVLGIAIALAGAGVYFLR